MQVLCLGRLPYSPDDPLHFELWQAVCWGFTGGWRQERAFVKLFFATVGP